MRAIWRPVGLSAVVYVVLSALLCGGPIRPIALLTTYSDHLGAPFWGYLVVAGAGIAAAGSFAASRHFATWRYALPMFVGFWMLISVFLVGGYATVLREQEVERFQPERYVASWFIGSLHNAPRDFQFFLHAAALKGCRPYAWSYREMAFYPLPVEAAVNVLPQEWLERCSIRRKD